MCNDKQIGEKKEVKTLGWKALNKYLNLFRSSINMIKIKL